jgi:hemerythrin HHE cation binding domain-containing protein
MSMNKVIHAAFRRDLDRFLGALSRFPDGDAARAHALGRAWDNFDFQLTKHHEGEHEIAWPALVQVGVTQQMIDQMDAEHEVMAERLSAARSSMAALRATPTAANAQTAHTAMGELKTVTVEHLDHEERELEQVYLANQDDPAIKQMGRQFGKVSPKEGGVFFAWMQDGASPEVKAGITQSVPLPVLKIIGGIFGRSYRKDIAPVWKS